MKKVVIVSDVRAVPLLAALKLARQDGGQRTLVTSARALRARDYGPNFYPRLYSNLKIKYLQVFHGLVVVDERADTRLSERDELGVHSSLCSITCDSRASRDRYPALYAELEALAKGAVEINDSLRAHRPDVVYVFNGRVASQYPCVLFCREAGIPVRYFEYSGKPRGFNLYDFPPHYGYSVGLKLVERFADGRAIDPAVEARAEEFRAAKLASQYVATYRSRPGESAGVVVFLSSDFEYTNLDEQLCGVQTLGNLGLCEAVFAKYGGSHRIAVRAHPNQRLDPSGEEVLRPVREFCEARHITYYPPESDVSSHALIETAQIVAVDCSTIAVDAILLGTQVDVFGQNDLAAILDSMPPEKRSNVAYLQQVVPVILALADEPFFVRFTRSEWLLAWLLAHLDRTLYRLRRLARAALAAATPRRLRAG